MALIHVNFFSNVLGMSSQMEVILPEERKEQIGISVTNNKRTIPVLYLLHGMTDNHTTWTRNTSIERYAVQRNIAVVMPNGHLGWYTNMFRGYDYYTYISQEIPEICERFFPALSSKRSGRFIAGNSMGGYGAMKIGLTNPDHFAGIASLSGAMDILSTIKSNDDQFFSHLWDDVFGPEDNIEGSNHDLFTLSEHAARHQKTPPSVYMWCGLDDFLHTQNETMNDHLKKINYPFIYKESSGDHSWKYWDREIVNILDWINNITEGGV